MYYGNPNAPDQSNPKGVWDDNFVMVQHLNETDIDGGAGDIKDSTSKNNGTTSGMDTNDQVTGNIDGSFDFDGSNDYVDVGNLQSLAGSSELTISVWFNARTLPTVANDNDGVCIQHDDYDEQMGFRFDGTSDILEGYVETGGISAGVGVPYSGNMVVNTWYHVVLTFDNGVVEVFFNSDSKGTNDKSGSFTTLPDLTNNMLFGSLNLYASDYFDGIIDEVRISNVARSATWIATEYNNQNDTSSFYSLGGEENIPLGWPYRKPIRINSSQVTSDLTNFPVLISLTDSDLKDKARSDAYDIYFTKSDGTTRLDHEIESYNSGTGELAAWVRFPNLSSTEDTIIYMYYGNPTATDQSNPTAVWDDNFTMVQHLNETGTGTRYDSTKYSNNGITSGYDGDEGTTGKINGADDLDGTNDYINCGNNDSISFDASETYKSL